MKHIHPTLSRALLTLSLAALAGAQTYTAKAGENAGGGGDQHSGSFPVTAFWDGSWTQSTRHASSRAAQGALSATAYCQTYAQYNMAACGIAELKYDDVVFTSTGAGPIQVGLKLLIEGNSAVTNGNGFKVSLKHGTHTMGEATRDAAGNITATYDLSGWNMSDLFPFEHAITVPVNTPVSLHLLMSVCASAVSGGQIANGHYTLRLGGPNPLPAPGKSYEVFSLPPGVTVDSVQGSIKNNIWTEPEDLYLSADTGLVAPGESLQLTTWNGVPGHPVGFSIGWGPALPPPAMGASLWTGFIGTLDVDGVWWADPMPNSSELAGATMLIRAVSLDPGGARVRSSEVEVQFQ